MYSTDKKLVYAVLFVFVLIFAAVALLWTFQPKQQQSPALASQMAKTKPATSYQQPTPKLLPVPAYQSGSSLSNLPPTLAPEAFTKASVRAAYAVAREIPQTLAELPCYCHCDKSIGHKSLHSCFTDDHGANCGTCMNEAMRAYQLQKEQKLSPGQIREKIIAEFSLQ
jgi:hypothetical protein